MELDRGGVLHARPAPQYEDHDEGGEHRDRDGSAQHVRSGRHELERVAQDRPLKAITISSSRWLEACWTQLRPYPETNPSRCRVVCVPEGSAGPRKST